MQRIYMQQEEYPWLALLWTPTQFQICSLLVYYVAYIDNPLQTFRVNPSVLSSSVKNSKKFR